MAQAKRELENQLADLEKQLNLEREKMLENVKVEHMKRIETESQLSELKQEMVVTKESVGRSYFLKKQPGCYYYFGTKMNHKIYRKLSVVFVF